MSRKRRHKKSVATDPSEAETKTVEVIARAEEPIEPSDENEPDETRHASADSPDEQESTELEAADDGSETDDEYQRLAAEAVEMRSLAQRKQAEFENYRRRVERERAETLKYAAADVIRDLLPVLDNLERAVDAAKATQPDSEDQLREGVEIICRQFRDTLDKLGLAEVKANEVPFDPHVHEAVGRVETDEHPEGTVVEVLQKGYMFKDRLLRPSMVSVSLPSGGGSSPDGSENEDEDEAVRQGE